MQFIIGSAFRLNWMTVNLDNGINRSHGGTRRIVLELEFVDASSCLRCKYRDELPLDQLSQKFPVSIS